jgi:hypothetical protein
METPITGREWTQVLKHLDLFGFGSGLDSMTASANLSQPTANDASTEQDGLGRLTVSNHQLIVTDGDHVMNQPWLVAEYPVILKVNGQVITEALQVHSSDQIEIELEQTPMFELRVSEDRLQLSFRAIREQQFAMHLVDQAASFELVLRAQELTDEPIATLSLDAVLKQIDAMKISAVVREMLIRNEINLISGEWIVIAEGIAPVASVDARIEKFFSDEIQNDFVQADEHDRVDFRSHMKIPSVKSNDVMARLHPPVAGKNGLDVYGQAIVPAPPKNYAIKARMNVTIAEGNVVIATKAGRPLMKGEDVLEFEVIPCFQWNADVDFRCGNIFFDGDVEINGNVMEGMSVESSGRVTVNGNVYRGMITSMNTVIVNGKVINGSIYAGQEPPHFQQLRQITNDLHEIWVQWLQAAKYVFQRLRKAGQAVRRGPLLMSLIQTKFQELPRKIRYWLHAEQQLTSSSDHPLSGLVESLRMVMSPNFWSEDGNFDKLEWIEQQLHQACLPPGGNLVKANIVIDQCQLSDLRATGDIQVRREGSIQSNIVAEGSIVFSDGSAICRGGQVVAGNRIVCGTLGSISGGYTMVKAGKEITAQQMNQGRIHIGRYTREIWSPIRKMKAYIDSNALVVAGLSD